MTTDAFDRWPDLDEIFARAIELPADERTRFLDERCASDPDLRAELKLLLAAHVRSTGFLDHPTVGSGDGASPDSPPLEVGERLGRYEITGKLGEGGMGEVWRADDTTLQRTVALKVLTLPPGDERAHGRLLHEARSASRLSHPNICTVYEVGEEDGRAYVAMEYVEGKTLDEVMLAGGLAVETALGYARQIADALACAHENGVVHRDLKGPNVVVTPGGVPKVLDFGIAQRMASDEVETLTRSTATLSEAGGVAGTLPYMAPETIRGDAVDARTDIWALGVLLQEMVTGRRPFVAATPAELMSAILRDPPAAVPDSLPAGVRGVIRRCLSKEPSHRYARASELSAALETLGAAEAGQVVGAGSEVSRRALVGVGGAVVALALGVIAFTVWMTSGDGLAGADSPSVSSIAVLPLENRSEDPEQEFFSDGMTDELINELSRIGSIRVISRTSSMQYKDRAMPLPESARELGVDGVLEGSVRRSGSLVRVIATLRHGETDEPLWAGDFDRELADVISLQRDVVRAIVDEIRSSVTDAEATRLASASTVQPDAHEDYLWGRHYWNRRTEADLLVAMTHFQRAIAADASYAAAYAGLADTYTMLGVYGSLPIRQVAELAKTAALRAIDLDAGEAQGYKALGYARFTFDWDWAGAEAALRRAVDLNPNDSAIRNWYATFLMAIGRTDEALEHIIRGRELDPLAPVVTVGVGLVHTFARRFDDAVRVLEDLLSKAPDFPPARLALGRVLLLQNDIAGAIAQIEAHVDDVPTAEARAELARAYALAGRRPEALEILETLRDPAQDGFMSVALAWFELGETDEAFRWIARAYDERTTRMIGLNAPWYDPMRSDPRFQDIYRRMNFPEDGLVEER